jgi:hypothetical protein
MIHDRGPFTQYVFRPADTIAGARTRHEFIFPQEAAHNKPDHRSMLKSNTLIGSNFWPAASSHFIITPPPENKKPLNLLQLSGLRFL